MATPKVISSSNGVLTQNNSSSLLNTQVSVTFDDQHAQDTLSYSYTSLNGPSLGNLTPVAFNDSGTGNIGFVTYQYSVPNAAIKYLAAGQTLTETFRVKATSTSSNLLSNGDFSAPLASSNDVPGWTVTNGQQANGLPGQSAFVQTINGNQVLLFGGGGSGSGGISQNFYGVVGTQYRLTFDFGTLGASGENQTVELYMSGVGGVLGTGGGSPNSLLLQDSTGSNDPVNQTDAHKTFDFSVSTTGTYTIRFTNYTNNWAGSSADSVIDNVELRSLNTQQTAVAGEVTQDVTVQITGTNDTPVLSAPSAAFSATEDTPSTYTTSALTASATDADTTDTLKVAGVSAISGGTPVLNTDGTVTFTPSANFNGTAKFSYTVTDGTATSNSAEVTVNVAPSSDPDTINTNATLAANGLTNGNLKAAGSGISGNNFVVATDTVDAPRLEIGMRADMRFTGQAARDVNDATLFLTPKGEGLGTPNTDGIPNNFDDTYARWNFTYSINADTAGQGGKIGDNAYSFVVSKVVGSTVTELTTLNLDTFLATLPTTTAQAVNNGSLLQDSLNLRALLGGSFDANELATYQIAVVANSRVNGSELLRDTIRIQVLNGAPVALGDSFSVAEDTLLNIAPIQLLGNDTDPDIHDTLKIASVAGGSGGTPTLNADGSVSFQPSANFNGVASFSYKATDGSTNNALSNSATVTVNVTPVNDAPVAVADTLNAIRNTAVTYTAAQLLGNDTDAENQSLKIKSVSSGTGGTVVLNTDGTVTFTPTTNFTGASSFSYIAAETSSPFAQSLPATVTVNINPPAVNTAAIVTTPARVSVNEGDTALVSINLLDGAIDSEGDVLSVSGLSFVVNGMNVASLPSGISLTGNTLSFDPSNTAFNALRQGQALDIRLTYNVVDGRGGVTPQSQSIVINGTNDNPVVSGPLTSITTKGASAYNVNLLTGAGDVDTGDNLYINNLTYAINGGLPSNATPPGVSLNGSILTINPQDTTFNKLYAGQTQTISLAYRVQDSFGGFTSQNETITVLGSGSAPNLSPTVNYLDASRTTEGADSYVLDLLRGATDPEGSPLSLRGLKFFVENSTSGTNSLPGLSVSSTGLLTVNPKDASFDSISSGSTRSILLNYLVSDGVNSTPQSQSIVITGTNDMPTVAAPLSTTTSKGDAAYSINLLDGANDVDASDNLYIANLSYTVDGLAIQNTPAGLVASGNKLTINPSDPGFNNLYNGQSQVIGVTYQVKDSFGAFVKQTETITINGTGTPSAAINHAPLFIDLPNGPLALTNGTNQRPFTFSVADPDGNPLTLTIFSSLGTVGGLADADAQAPGLQLSGSASQINAALSSASFSSTQNSTVTLALSDGITTTTGSIRFSPSAALGTSANMSPYGGVSITGLQQVGQILSANTSNLNDPNGLPTALNYQWLRDGLAISNASSKTYQVTNTDSGHDLSVQVSYRDLAGYDESVTSYTLTAFGGKSSVNQAPYGGVSIYGSAGGAQKGSTLTAVTAQLVDPNGIDPNGVATNKAFAYQWLRDGQSISSATSNSYEVNGQDIGHNLSVSVSFVDLLANRETVNSYDLYAYL